MRAIILAGGRGSRLEPLTQHLPKPLIPFFGRPLIEHQIRWLASYGVTEIIISVGHFGSMIERTLGPTMCGAQLFYAHESQPLGTAGATAWALAQYPTSETTLVMAGDCLTDYPLDYIINHFEHQPVPVGIVLHRVEDARQFGVIEMDPRGRITRLIEKPTVIAGPQLVNTGIYILKPGRLTWPPRRPLDFAYDLFPVLIARGEMAGLEVEGYWSDLGTLTQYRESHFDVMRGRVMLPFDLDNDVSNIVVDSQARIIEPVWLGDGVTIDAQATVGPNVVLGAGSYVGPWTHVENTVVGQSAFLGAGTRAHDAIVGDGVAFGGRCHVGPQSAIGAGTRIGWGTDVSPGAKIPANTRLAPKMRLGNRAHRGSAVTS